MQYLYSFLISFTLIFFSELGDKTQILVLSFSAKNKTIYLLLGVALGTILSHGLAITFGCNIGILSSTDFILYIKAFTYCTFIFLGILGFIQFNKKNYSKDSSNQSSNSYIIKILNSFTKNCILIVAIAIAIGEIGDKTFLASLGLGLEYPFCKFSLICGSVLGMVASNSIAIFLGKWLTTKISLSTIEKFSNIIFILFGVVGILTIFIK